MMSKKEYMYWQNRKYRVSEYICVRASGVSERFLEFYSLKGQFLYNKMSNLRLSYLQKVGGCLYRPFPTQKSGGGGIYPPIPPPPGIYASAWDIYVPFTCIIGSPAILLL